MEGSSNSTLTSQSTVLFSSNQSISPLSVVRQDGDSVEVSVCVQTVLVGESRVDTSGGHGAVSRARRLACPWPAAAYHSARCDTAVLVARPTSSPSSSRAPPPRTTPRPTTRLQQLLLYCSLCNTAASRLLFRPVVALDSIACLNKH